MVDKKLEIYKSAKILFEQYGYSEVSLRDIAKHAGTSIGNLTYHFPKKEDLMLKIQEDLYKTFFSFIDSEIEDENAFSLLIYSIQEIQKIREQNTFYYKYVVNIHEEFPSMKKELLIFRQKLTDFYLAIFLALKRNGLMRNDITDEEYEKLTVILSYLTYTWYQITTPYYDSEQVMSLAESLQTLLLPYLTDEGRKLLRQNL